MGEKGLLTLVTRFELDERLQVLKAVWNPEFWDYFVTYVADDMKEGMAPEIRRIIGLKDDFYYDNTLEFQNFRYKQKIEEAKQELRKNLELRLRNALGWRQEKMRGQRGRFPVQPLGYVMSTKVIFRRVEVFALAEVCLPRCPHAGQPRSDV